MAVQSIVEMEFRSMTLLAIHRKLPAFRTVLAKTFSWNWVQDLMHESQWSHPLSLDNRGVGRLWGDKASEGRTMIVVNNGLPLQCFVCSEPSDAAALTTPLWEMHCGKLNENLSILVTPALTRSQRSIPGTRTTSGPGLVWGSWVPEGHQSHTAQLWRLPVWGQPRPRTIQVMIYSPFPSFSPSFMPPPPPPPRMLKVINPNLLNVEPFSMKMTQNWKIFR